LFVNFATLALKTGCGKTIVESKKFQLFRRVSISHKNLAEGTKGIKSLRSAFYLGITRKRRGRRGFLNFVPKVELGDLKFGSIIFLPLFLP